MDAGLVTQRIQQDIIAKLDKIIEASSKPSGGEGKGEPKKQEQGSAKNQKPGASNIASTTPQTSTPQLGKCHSTQKNYSRTWPF